MAGVQQRGIGMPTDVGASAPLPMRSPASFGAAVGEGMEQLGSELQREQVRAKEAAARRQYQVDASTAGVAAAQASLDVSQQIDEIRNEAAPGAAGHVDAVSKAVDDRFGEVLSGISNPVLRNQFAEDLARSRARLIGEESTWAAGQKVAFQVSNVKETGQLLGNQVLSKPDAGTFSDALKTLTTTIGNQGLSADKAEALLRDQGEDLAISRAKGAIQVDPKQALQLLAGEELTPWLPSDKRAALIGEAETQLRIQEADQRRQQAQAAAQLREDVTEFKQRVDRGELPSDEETGTLAGRAQALGLTNLVDDIGYSAGKLKYSRITDKWTAAEWESNVNSLAAKVAQGKASAEEQQELKILQELRGPKEARFRNDPDGYAAASGSPPPQVDLANPEPGAVNARKSWARAYAKQAGLLEAPYLSKDQLNVYRQRAAQGPVGQLEAAEELKATWGDAAPSIVRQIGGASAEDMKVMLGLNPAIAQRYRRGHEALEKKAVELNDGDARQMFGSYARGLPSDLQPAVFDAARKIAAGWMLEQGFSKPPQNFDQVFGAALQYAAGRTGNASDFNAPGGLAEINGRYAWLPGDMTSNDFLRRIVRAQPSDWVNAATDERGNPVKSVPHYIGPDGKPKPYTKGDALRFSKGTLQTLDQGLYHLVDPLGHTVVDERGHPWTFDVRRLPR